MDCDLREEVALRLSISGNLGGWWFTLAHRATPQKTFVLSCSSDWFGPSSKIEDFMNRKGWLCAITIFSLFFALPGAFAQYANAAAESNAILMQINQASSDAQRDVAQLRIDKWK